VSLTSRHLRFRLRYARLSAGVRAVMVVSVLWLIAISTLGFNPLLFSPLSRLFVGNFTFGSRGGDPRSVFLGEVVWSRAALVMVLPICGLASLMWAAKWIVAGASGVADGPYLKKHRLQDVIALIQLLALGEWPHRSESAVREDLQGDPRSGGSWALLAREHPEFFRVEDDVHHPISLLARHTVRDPRNRPTTYGNKPTAIDHSKLVVDLTKVAIDLHDRQERLAQRWQAFVPIATAVLGAAVAIIVAVFK